MGAFPLDAPHLALVVLAFLIGGVVKGTVGIGLPTVSLAILSSALGLVDAIAIMALPAVCANLLQALQGDALVALARRHWPLLLGAFAGVWLGTAVLFRVDPLLLTGALGALLCLYALLGLVKVPVRVPRRAEPVLGPPTGVVTGLVVGATGSLVLPLMVYLQGLGLDKDRFVQLTGMAATVLTGTLALAVAGGGLYAGSLAPVSAMALVPSFAGMYLGRRVRRNLSEARFRTWLFVALFLLGANLLRKGLL